MASNNNNRLGDLLRKARMDTSYSQREVEAETGISNAYLSQLEGGKVREPSPTILHKLAELYSIEYVGLLAATGYPVPTTNRKKKAAFRPDNSLGPISKEEEKALSEYLSFLRSKERR